MGIAYGTMTIFLMSIWSSYNCWTVVRLKQYIQRNHPDVDATSLTYPGVSKWAYGSVFESYTLACVCAQQLAICTVFVSFIGENLRAVLGYSHVTVMTLCLPAVLALSMLPTMKRLAPFMALGTLLLAAAVGLLGVVLVEEWDHRPNELPQLDLKHIPLATCAILYSYEGICLVLPVESSMEEPKHFKYVFWTTMALIACILASFGTINVIVFGDVTNGSLTAYLLDEYGDHPSIAWFVMAANTSVSLSVLVTYPIELFPAIELIGTTYLAKVLGCFRDSSDKDDAGFVHLPPLPEDSVVEKDPLIKDHQYGTMDKQKGDDKQSQSFLSSIIPHMVMTGDSIQLRLFLVVMTYSVAVVIPNVQVLISLVGALAGSSTALLIPPLLEVAWLCRLEELAAAPSGWIGGKYWASKLFCYILFVLGLVFAVIGTYSSIQDIVRAYQS